MIAFDYNMNKKKVLIIAYYWPPAGGPGVQRWLKFVKYLPEFDIDPILYIPSNPSYPIKDFSLKNEIPKGLTIIKQPILEPYSLARKISKGTSDTISRGIISNNKKQGIMESIMLFIRGNFFIPDARIRWIKPSFNYLSNYIRDFKIDTIITTGPPHSLHLIGLKLKERHDLKWISDFRDPWTTISYHKKLKLLPWAVKKHKLLETKVLNNTDNIIVTSPNAKTIFSRLTKQPITVITNGYDQKYMEEEDVDQKFSIAHIGSLLSDRNPLNLWEALAELIEENQDFASYLQLNFIGLVSETVLSCIEKNGLKEFINIKGYLTHNEALRYQKTSQLLLLIEIDSEDTKCIIPGKLFEYLVSGRPILAIGPEDSDVADILNKTNTGNYFLYSEKEAIKKAIQDMFRLFQANNLNINAVQIEKYSRRYLTSKLATVIT